ncbi:MAG: methylmalonyl Co-A mutase-associated GTPase MeaB [Anaerolineaceae bacterium]|nr:methylmalonyl Co-A mutase-associated GTPase MeaB [Anaerolineaceae bacterium]MDE0329811.1 methylmalonyl Co-A mutase-associated GTPase MeaB [Anaerolineaceae bacterium]
MPEPVDEKAVSVDELSTGVLAGERVALAQAITLVESSAKGHRQLASALLHRLRPQDGNAIRIGITGVPGAGKSTLIEALGLYLVGQGKRVAVLAIDPSSSVSGGSILGDKMRMSSLARSRQAFIRPSPSAGTPGGVASRTRECMLLCEAAGHDVIFLETVGSGQGEIAARSMVDFFLLLLVTGTGDSLQGMKKGVMELANAIAVNKADGANQAAARAARADMERALRLLSPSESGWRQRVVTCSALEGVGIEELWSIILEFRREALASGHWYATRQEQRLAWLHALLKEGIRNSFYTHREVQEALPEYERAVLSGEVNVSDAARELLNLNRTGERSPGVRR